LARRQRKPRRPEKPRFRINHQIRVPKIRLVGDNLEEIGKATGKQVTSDIYPTRDALGFANAMNLDLVEISPKADPPVCRVIDYKKFLFDRKKKDKELKAKTVKTVIKEIRFGPNTDDHDFNFKARHAEKFLKEGAKVKAYVHFRGRTIVFKERGEVLLLRFVKHLEEFGTIESMPRMEGRRMFVMVAPKKSALKPSKKAKAAPKSEKKKGKQAAEKPVEEVAKTPDAKQAVPKSEKKEKQADEKSVESVAKVPDAKEAAPKPEKKEKQAADEKPVENVAKAAETRADKE